MARLVHAFKFGDGDTVRLVFKERLRVWAPCTFCGAAGMIKGRDDATIVCPMCYGRKGKHERHALRWQVSPESLTIGQAEVVARFERPGRFTGEQTGCVTERYMCEQTGIGSGSNHAVENLFPSVAEAQAECDRRNSADKEAKDGNA